jgi:hypothetical protein
MYPVEECHKSVIDHKASADELKESWTAPLLDHVKKCSGMVDCNLKRIGLCKDPYESFVNLSETQAYCSKKFLEYDPLKRGKKIEDREIQAQIDKDLKDIRDARMDRIKSGCRSATGLTKDLCAEIAGE